MTPCKTYRASQLAVSGIIIPFHTARSWMASGFTGYYTI